MTFDPAPGSRHARGESPLAAGAVVAIITVGAAAVLLGGIAFDRRLVRRELRHIIKTSRGGEAVLDAACRRDSPDFLTADILRVHPGAGRSEDFLKELSWSSKPVLVPFVGSDHPGNRGSRMDGP